MQRYEYKAVTPPDRGEKAPGAKTADDRYANAVMNLMNRLGRDGWDYVRTDTFTREDKVGLARRSVTVHQTLMVFRRPLEGAMAYAEAPRSSFVATRTAADTPAWQPLILDKKEPKLGKDNE